MPSKRKKTTGKRTKSKIATTKRSKLRPKKAAKKKESRKKAPSRTSPARKTETPRSDAQRLESSRRKKGVASARQSGDLEDLSRVPQADSESVDELVAEGNVYEAGAVAGVEEADDQDAREVHTHEVPEDDVPNEYLDKD